MISVDVKPYILRFLRPAGTSRGIYRTRKSWFVIIRKGDCVGIGECAPLPNLSCDDVPNYEELLRAFCRRLEEDSLSLDELSDYPSMRFGIETALRSLDSANGQLWKSDFSDGASGIVINGLIWMGSHEYMLEQIEKKMQQGFKCLKLKVGAIDFEQELDLAKHIRMRYSPPELEIRLDANGGFTPANAMERLSRFAEYSIHSIEQPIRQGQTEAMARIAEQSPIPIALDEELIGVNALADKMQLITTIRPQYIILKPSLHGGIAGTAEWIDAARKMGIDWWMTSALESNVGLNAIAQWAATYRPSLPQGLGTGLLFENNIDSPLYLEGERLWFDRNRAWNASTLYN